MIYEYVNDDCGMNTESVVDRGIEMIVHTQRSVVRRVMFHNSKNLTSWTEDRGAKIMMEQKKKRGISETKVCMLDTRDDSMD